MLERCPKLPESESCIRCLTSNPSTGVEVAADIAGDLGDMRKLLYLNIFLDNAQRMKFATCASIY